MRKPEEERGFIFDLDGVIVDTEEAHREAWRTFIEERGNELTEDLWDQIFGRTNQQIIKDVLGWTEDLEEIERMGKQKEKLFRSAVRRSGIKEIPGSVSMVKELSSLGFFIGICSSTPRKNIQVALRSTSLKDVVDVEVSGQDVEKGKPSPDPFLRTAGKLKILPENCVVIEDSPAGIQGAREAGMTVVALSTTHSAEQLSSADRILDNLQTDPEQLIEMLPEAS